MSGSLYMNLEVCHMEFRKVYQYSKIENTQGNKSWSREREEPSEESVKTVETTTPSKKLTDCGSVRHAEECDHDWEEIGCLITYPKDEVTDGGRPYSGYMEVQDEFVVCLCKKCGEVKLKWNPWKRILE